MNPDGSIQFANDAWLKLIGISKEAVENNSLKPWLATVHPDDLQNVHQQWQSLKEGISSALHEWRVLRRGESNNSQPDVAYLRSAAYAEVNGDGNLKAVTGITIDYSIEVAHLRETNAKMEAALEAKRAQENFMGKLYCVLWQCCGFLGTIEKLTAGQTWSHTRCEILYMPLYNVRKRPKICSISCKKLTKLHHRYLSLHKSVPQR